MCMHVNAVRRFIAHSNGVYSYKPYNIIHAFVTI